MRGVVGRAGTTELFDLDRWVPAGPVAHFVEHFWAVRWSLDEPHESTVITFPAVHLTNEWGTDGSRHGHVLPAVLVHGVVERVFRTTIRGTGAVVGARFHPGGFTARYGRDAGSLTGRVERADELLPQAPHDVEKCVDAMESVISTDAPLDDTYLLLRKLVERIREDDKLHRVANVMELSPWSARTTQRVFRRYVGVPVKWVLCRYRLQQAALEIERQPGIDFADLAVRLGWYDQAHFINDFRSMLGCTPSEYAAEHGG
ncbi:helix-turn-helix domain-containing protein [Mycobacterium sp.]|uniref:AraC family transcriptional regulator n=1 Tax=Mycobacterium sp. TaxID=1785 RepID=UPI002C70F2DE|nr:helix-turn-helix domain-containing protein [Mycobacterium sp.]HKP42830.1 helix-turn-helix domain-containing protein [Mycobacterium sp.]